MTKLRIMELPNWPIDRLNNLLKIYCAKLYKRVYKETCFVHITLVMNKMNTLYMVMSMGISKN